MENLNYEKNYLEIIAFSKKIKYFQTDNRIIDESQFLLKLEEIKNIYYTKESDYSNGIPLANFRESLSIGIQPYKGVLIRMGDKIRRLKTFQSKKYYKVSSESQNDTLCDLANYSMLGLILYQEIDHSKSTFYDENESLMIGELYKWISIVSVLTTLIDNDDPLHILFINNIFDNYNKICNFVKGIKD